MHGGGLARLRNGGGTPGGPQHHLNPRTGGQKGGHWIQSYSLLTPVGRRRIIIYFQLEVTKTQFTLKCSNNNYAFDVRSVCYFCDAVRSVFVISILPFVLVHI